MDWMNVLQQVFEIALFPILGALSIYAVVLINTKANELKKKTDNEMAKKYIDMLDKTITECVIATNQTYVNSLKEQGKFDLEAQKIAFQKTYTAVLAILTEDAKEYLQSSISDLTTYITSKIECEVAIERV